MELGIVSFGHLQNEAATGRESTSGATMRHLVEAMKLADEVGLDYFGLGEHHLPSMPVSQPAVVLAAGAAVTRNIRLGSSITVLGAEDPVRVFEQYATLDGISGGRAEVTVGRGAFLEPFHLYGIDLNGYDEFFAEKLDLLNELNTTDRITWQGKYRPPLDNAWIAPQPDQPYLPVWIGTGGKPGSIMRAARGHNPIMFSDIGADPATFARLADLYREAARRADAPQDRTKVGIVTVGYAATDGPRARKDWRHHFRTRVADLGMMHSLDRIYEDQTRPGGSFFIGNPEEIAERIIALHGVLGHDRHIFESDWGRLPYSESLRSIELFGTQVKPLVDEALKDATVPGAA